MVLMALFAAGAAVFLFFIGQDALNEQHAFQFFADSNTYHQIYAAGLVSFDGELIGVASNYAGPLLVLEILAGNIYLIMLLNTVLFSVSILRTSSLLRLNPLKLAALLLLSPLTISTLLSVNKEIFVFPFIALALAGYMRRSFTAVILALLVSMLVRWQLTAFYVVMLAISGPIRVARRGTVLLALLMALSALYALAQTWLAPVVAAAELSIENYDEGGSGLFEAMLAYQKEGLYFLLFPVKAAHLLFSLGLRFDKFFNPVDVYNDLFIALHCTSTLLVFLLLLRKRRFTLNADLIFATAVFLSIFCLSPIFAPRYLFPVFVTWVLVLVGAPQSLPRSMRIPVRPRTQASLKQIRRALRTRSLVAPDRQSSAAS